MGVIFKSKREKQEDEELKEFYEEMDRMDEEIEKELQEPKTKNIVLQLFNILEKDPLEEELKNYMSDEEKRQEEKDKKDAMEFSIYGLVLVICICVACGIILFTYVEVNLDDMHKIELPKITAYYENKYGSTPNIDEIHYLCYTIKNENREKEEVCTDYVYAKTDKNEVILSKEGRFGDTISKSDFYEKYTDELRTLNPNLQMIWHNPHISYSDYYLKFNQFDLYSRILPTFLTYDALKASNKMNIVDVIMYQGEIDINSFKPFLMSLADDSKFFFIKTNAGEPVNVKVMDKTKMGSLDVTGAVNVADGVINYQINTYQNNVNDVSVVKITDNSIESLDKESDKEDDYYFTNAYDITYTSVRGSRRDERANYPSYYLLQFNNLEENNIIEFSGSREIKDENYKDFYHLSFGGKTYLLSENRISIANKHENIKKGGLFG